MMNKKAYYIPRLILLLPPNAELLEETVLGLRGTYVVIYSTPASPAVTFSPNEVSHRYPTWHVSWWGDVNKVLMCIQS